MTKRSVFHFPLRPLFFFNLSSFFFLSLFIFIFRRAPVKSGGRGFGWASSLPGLRLRILAKRPERRIKSIKRVLAEQQQAAEHGVSTPRRTALKRGANSMPNLTLPKGTGRGSNSSSGEFKAQNSGGQTGTL